LTRSKPSSAATIVGRATSSESVPSGRAAPIGFTVYAPSSVISRLFRPPGAEKTWAGAAPESA
jgi:hypothetical protein